jgi:uncharacterized protein YbaP (TraB family)
MMAHGQRIRAAVGPVLLFAAVTGPGWAATASGPPLLWRVAGCTPGPSYVFAILHSADPRVTTLPRPVRAALNASARLVMEVLPTSATLTVLSAESFDPDEPGRAGLASRLGPGLFAATARRIAPYGVSADLLRHMRPWAVVATLSLPRPSAGMFQELVVYLRAHEAHKPTSALLDPGSQIALFEKLPARVQVALVRAVVRRHGAALRAIAEQRRAYRAGDLPALARLRADYPTFRGDPVAARAFRALLRRIAHRVVVRLLPQLRAGSRFATVTAINLPGPDGVLHGLRAAGCTLQRASNAPRAPGIYAGVRSGPRSRQDTISPARNATTRPLPKG